jgi:hypothetical protein
MRTMGWPARGRQRLALAAVLVGVMGVANPAGAWDRSVTLADGYFEVLLLDNDGVASTPTETVALTYIQDSEGNLMVGYARSRLVVDTRASVLDTRCETAEGIAADGTALVAACSYSSLWDIWKRRLVVHRFASGRWSAGVLVQGSTKPAPDSASIAISGSLVVVGWTDYKTGAIEIARSSDGGATFKAPVRLGTTRTLDIEPGSGRPSNGRVQVAIHGQRVYVVWLAGSSSSTSQHRWPTGLTMRRSTDGGRHFMGRQTLVPGVELPGPGAVVATDSGVLILHATGKRRLRLLRSTDGGRTFHAASLTGNQRVHGDLDLAVHGSSVRAIWRFGSRVYLRRSEDGGSTWAAQEDTGVRRRSGAVISPNVGLLGDHSFVAWNDMGDWGGLGGQWVQATVAP